MADPKALLEWLFANCRIVYFPPGGQYPIEHNPHALGYDKDGSNFLAFTSPYRPAGVQVHDEPKPCKRCHGEGCTNEGDPEIGNAYFECEACGGTGRAKE